MKASILIFYVMALIAISYAGNFPGKQTSKNLEETHCRHRGNRITKEDCNKLCLKLGEEVMKLSTRFKVKSGFCRKKCRCVVENYFEPINHTLTLSKSLEKLENNHYESSRKLKKETKMNLGEGTYTLFENSIDY